MFRRRRGGAETVVTEAEVTTGDSKSWTGGPWDAADAPADGLVRVDLGALLVPVTERLELRVDVDQSSQQVVSVTLATPSSAMQVLAFAAPRTSGIWAEVRAEIGASLRGGGGSAEEVEGPYGVELRAQVPTDVAGKFAPARFLGVDGPRWFLRAMIQGTAAVDPAADPVLLAGFGQICVVRGDAAMAVRDALPLRLPKDEPPPPSAESHQDGVQGGDQQQDTTSLGVPSLELPARGPEITETR